VWDELRIIRVRKKKAYSHIQTGVGNKQGKKSWMF